MKKIILALICLFAACGGGLWLAIQREWIIIQAPTILSFNTGAQNHKRMITCYVWHHDHWQTETQELVMSDDGAQNLRHLIAAWLSILSEEDSSLKKIYLQSALIDPTGISAYISFDRSPFAKNVSTLSKVMWIEGLLKTVRENNIPIQTIYFLVRHQALTDTHLDFSHPWPITGFTNHV
jgi:hypothetical protein